MKLVIQREELCDHAVVTCERCLGRVIEKPLGYDRHCILEAIDDESENLTLTFRAEDGQEKTYSLTLEQQQLLVSEGWSAFIEELDRSEAEEE